MFCFLQNKYKVFGKFKELKPLKENQTKKKIEVFRIDNGGEFHEKYFEWFYMQCGIAW